MMNRKREACLAALDEEPAVLRLCLRLATLTCATHTARDAHCAYETTRRALPRNDEQVRTEC
jgi:hypothetical protein